MLKEYAVNPTVMGKSLLQFTYLLDSLGFDRGRLISKIHSNWVEQVIEAADEANIGQRDIHIIIEKLQEANLKRTFFSQRTVYDAQKSWIDNALAHEPETPLQAILNDEGVSGQENVITMDDILAEHPLWKTTHNWKVPRSARELADAMKPLILAAKQIWIIDPHFTFQPGPNRSVETLIEILKDINNAPKPPAQFQIHYRSHSKRRPMEMMRETVSKKLIGLIPRGMHLELYEWELDKYSDAFHDRHLLSDFGGLSIGHGFDAVGSHQKALFQLHTYEMTQTIKTDFEIESSSFRLAQPILSISYDGSSSLVSPKSYAVG